MTWPRRSRWMRPSPCSISTMSSSIGAVEQIDVIDETLVGHGLRRRGIVFERNAARRLRASVALGARLAVQRGEVVEVDDGQDVLERLRQARKEAGSRCISSPFARAERIAVVQAVVGETIRRAPACAGRRAAPWTRLLSETAGAEPALDLVAPVVAPERLAVDDEERRTEDALRDRVGARRLQAALPARLGPDALGLGGVEAEFRRQRLQVLDVREVDAAAREVGAQAVARPVRRALRVAPPRATRRRALRSAWRREISPAT